MAEQAKASKVTVTYGYSGLGGPSPVRARIVTYYVGRNGPFTLAYALTDYNAARVQQDMQAQIDTLAAIGALD